ncbi:MAG TPA: hypothetical protein PKC45_15095 [Gemmatales bacterium]|nr:hypothetical protein [Gemmatales bacterium]
MFDRIFTPLIALSLGFLVWVYIRSRDEAVYEPEIPVQVQLAPSQTELFQLDQSELPPVPIAFTGPPSRIREVRNLFRDGALRIQQVVTVPEERMQDPSGRVELTVTLDASGLRVPPGVMAVIPSFKNRVSVVARRIIERRLSVRLNHPAGDRLQTTAIEPSQVLVRGPKDVLDRATVALTELYVPPAASDDDKPIREVGPQKIRLIPRLGDETVQITPSEVQFRATLKGPQRIHELENVPVFFLTPANFPYKVQFLNERAGTITLRLRGPVSEERPVVYPYVNLASRRFGAGLNADEPIRVDLPPGYSLVQEPPKISFQLIPLDVPAEPVDGAFKPS